MTTGYPALNWQEMPGSDPSPVANLTLDFSANDTYVVQGLRFEFSGSDFNARGITIDAGSYEAVITLHVGPISYTINQFQRNSFTLPDGIQSVSISCSNTSVTALPVLVWINKPASSADGVNMYLCLRSMIAGPFGTHTTGALSNGLLQTILLPANNTNGAIIRWAIVAGNGTATARLFANKTAPSGYNDYLSGPFLWNDFAANTSIMPNQLDLPSGYGIWFFGSSAGSAEFAIGYDLL